MKPPVVEVEWIDACNRLESCRLSEVKASPHTFLVKRTTVGFLVHKDRHRIVLAKDYDEPSGNDGETEPSVGTFTVIPRPWVKIIRTIQEER